MKSATIFFLGCLIVAGAVIYAYRQKSAPAPLPVVATTDTSPVQPAPSPVAATQTAPVPAIPATPTAPAPAIDSASATTPAKSDADIAFGKLVDKLISHDLTGLEKHNLFEQLRKNGQLDQAIAALQQRAAADPTNPEIPTTIGEAMLNKLRDMHDNGADVNEMGILAMQADQSFNAALKIDPSNYEAQLVKSISMTYWPADPTRDAQVIQTFTTLIDQQESMPASPDYAQTYIYLGNEYQKMGQSDKAMATWQLGIQKYPDNTILQQKIAGTGTQ